MEFSHYNNATVLKGHDLECVRDDRILFSGLGFTLEAGKILLLEGRNGSGKTSLLRILCGIRLPDAGRVSWCGDDIERLGPEYHEHIAYVGHRDGLKLELSPQENLVMARGLGKASPDVGIDAALARVELDGYQDVPTRNLSAGQQRRLALARLLVTRAQLWILDEPFTSLDRHGIKLVEGLLGEHISRGGMLAMTSHHEVKLDAVHVQRKTLPI